MATKRDYYDILGATKGATLDEIKRSYRKLALEWHPDRNKSSQANERFKEINEAYAVLSDKEKRSAYDQFGHAAFAPGGGFGGHGPQGAGGTYRQGPFTYTYYTSGGAPGQSPFGGFSDFIDPFEIFEQFFGGGFSPRGVRQRREAFEISIDFMEAVKGVTKEVHMPRGQAGEGSIRKTIKIPAGVDTGSRVRFEDFDIVVNVRSDKRFRREGDDVIVTHEIPYTTAVLGGIETVATVHGSVKIRIQPGTQPGTLIRLRGQGISHVRGSGKGDEYVKIQIHVPAHANRHQKELFEELASFDER